MRVPPPALAGFDDAASLMGDMAPAAPAGETGGAPAVPVKRGRGRPPGARNRPKEGEEGSGGPSIVPSAGERQQAASAPQPLKPTSVQSGTANAELRKLMADPARVASTLSIVLDGGFQALVKHRHGDDAAKHTEITPAERAEVEAALLLFLRSTGAQVSPGANLALTLGGVYALKLAPLEMQRFQAKRAAR